MLQGGEHALKLLSKKAKSESNFPGHIRLVSWILLRKSKQLLVKCSYHVHSNAAPTSLSIKFLPLLRTDNETNVGLRTHFAGHSICKWSKITNTLSVFVLWSTGLVPNLTLSVCVVPTWVKTSGMDHHILMTKNNNLLRIQLEVWTLKGETHPIPTEHILVY